MRQREIPFASVCRSRETGLRNLLFTMPLRTIFKYYWLQMKKYPKSMAAVFVLYMVAGVVANTFSPLIYKNIIDVASSGSATPEMVQRIFFWAWALAGLATLWHVLYRLGDYVSVFFESNVLRDLADDAFDRVHNHSAAFFADNFSGSLVSKTKRFIWSFSGLFNEILWSILSRLVQVFGAIVVLFLNVPAIAWMYSLWIILFIILSVWFVRKKMPYDLEEASMDSQAVARYADTVTNAMTIKMFGSKSREVRSFLKISDHWERVRRKAWLMRNYQIAIQGILFFFLEVGVMFLVAQLWSENRISVGTIVLVQIYIFGTFDAVWGFGRSLMNIEKSLSDASEMVEIFEQKASVEDPVDPEACRIKSGDIEFRKVSFVYEKGGHSVFRDFSLHINPGEKVGVVGHSGAGKTTITKMLLRFADVSDGAVLIDGQDIRNIRQDDLRKSIAYVSQEPMLFHRTIRENIAYGKPSATEEEILVAAKRAHAHEFIEKFPRGYDTLVGERGVKLSGGERQRVAIARAMLKNAPILVLDEATSSLDSVSEKHIQEALDELMKGRTVIVIAHRLSTIQKMDRILVVENGKIVEEGSHEDLVSRGGVYATFWKQQAGGFIGE